MGNAKNLKPFKKGHKKLGGRKKGVPNKFPSVLTEAVLVAAETCGEDGEGFGGLVGYCMMLSDKYPKHFIRLLARVMMLQEKDKRAPTSYPCHLEFLTDEEFKQFSRLLVKAQVPFRPVKVEYGQTRLEPVDPRTGDI